MYSGIFLVDVVDYILAIAWLSAILTRDRLAED